MRERGKCDEGKRGRPIVRRGQSQITQQEKEEEEVKTVLED